MKKSNIALLVGITLSLLAGYYSYHFSTALNLRFYNDLKDESYKAAALSDCDKSIEYFTKFANN